MGEKNNDAIFTITPKFNFIYELFMPTGAKIKNSLFMVILFFSLAMIFANFSFFLNIGSFKITENLTLEMLLLIVIYFMFGIAILKFAFHIFFQVMQYKYITYSFYNDHMIYKDDFLNQHKKNILYSNVKEVEIRRSIWDRILNFGIIVIYTNAENDASNGLVIYGVKDPNVFYEQIDDLIHNKKNIETNIVEQKEDVNIKEEKNITEDANTQKIENTVNNEIEEEVKDQEQEELDFKNSLKNLK